MKGNTGKIINVDLTVGTVKVEELPEEHYRKYIGGSGLATMILSPVMFSRCFGLFSLLRGQNLVPFPPAMITAYILIPFLT